MLETPGTPVHIGRTARFRDRHLAHLGGRYRPGLRISNPYPNYCAIEQVHRKQRVLRIIQIDVPQTHITYAIKGQDIPVGCSRISHDVPVQARFIPRGNPLVIEVEEDTGLTIGLITRRIRLRIRQKGRQIRPGDRT
jgi:hypothetical protein